MIELHKFINGREASHLSSICLEKENSNGYR